MIDFHVVKVNVFRLFQVSFFFLNSSSSRDLFQAFNDRNLILNDKIEGDEQSLERILS